MKQLMKNLLVAFFLVISAQSAQAGLVGLPHGIIVFGNLDPFQQGGKALVHDYNENLPDFWVDLSKLSFDTTSVGTVLLRSIPGSGFIFDPVFIERVHIEDMELSTSMGHMSLVDDATYGKSLFFGNASLQVTPEAALPVPEPSSLALLMAGLSLMLFLKKTGSPKAKYAGC